MDAVQKRQRAQQWANRHANWLTNAAFLARDFCDAGCNAQRRDFHSDAPTSLIPGSVCKSPSGAKLGGLFVLELLGAALNGAWRG